jgi:hypothetical protein
MPVCFLASLAICTSETLADFQRVTRRYILEDRPLGISLEVLYLDDINLMNEYQTINHDRGHRICGPECYELLSQPCLAAKVKADLGFSE